MIGIFRTSIPGSSVAGLAAATAAQALFFTAVSVMMLIGVAVLLPRVVSKGSPADETGGFFASHRPDSSRRCRGDRDPDLPLAAVEALAPQAMAQGEAGSCHLQRLASLREGGGASVRRLVLLPHRRQRRLHGRLRHPRDRTPSRVASSHMLSGLFAITPGGVGQTQALDVATLGRHAPTENVAAFSVTQDSILMMWNVALGVALMLWAFGYAETRQLLEDTPEAGAGARLHLNQSLPRPGSRRSGEPRRTGRINLVAPGPSSGTSPRPESSG